MNKQKSHTEELLMVELEDARAWRKKRVKKIKKNNGHYQIAQGPTQVVHFIPLLLERPIDITSRTPKEQLASITGPSDGMNEIRRINAHGWIKSKQESSSTEKRSYIQLYRTGRIEAVTLIASRSSQPNIIASQILDKEILQLIDQCLTALKVLNVSLPILITASYHNIAGQTLAGKNYDHWGADKEYYSILKNSIPHREIILSNWPAQSEIPKLFSDIVNLPWNASGHAKSHYYESNGDHELAD